MALWRAFTSGLRRLFFRDAADHDLDDELGHYLALATEDGIRRGLTPEEAARAARARMGGLEAAKTEVRLGGWEAVFDSFGQDVRVGIRGLRPARFHARGGAVARARHRREHDDVQHRERRVVPALALPRRRPPRDGVDRRHAPRPAPRSHRVRDDPRLARAQRHVRRGGVLLHAAHRGDVQRSWPRSRPHAKRARLRQPVRRPRRGAVSRAGHLGRGRTRSRAGRRDQSCLLAALAGWRGRRRRPDAHARRPVEGRNRAGHDDRRAAAGILFSGQADRHLHCPPRRTGGSSARARNAFPGGRAGGRRWAG